MNQTYLELLESIKDTLDEIRSLREDLDDLLANPVQTLNYLERMRDILSEIHEQVQDTFKGIQELREDLEG